MSSSAINNSDMAAFVSSSSINVVHYSPPADHRHTFEVK
jgi:hypothetical protein